ncbi:MAG: RDD family protein [Acidobacteriota bacterium]
MTKPAVAEPLEPEPVVSKALAPEPAAQDPIIERAPLPEPADLEIDRPLVKVPAVAREPLSVRRPVETTKPKSVEPEIVLKKDPSADRDLLAGMRLFDSEEFEPPVVHRPESRAVGGSASEPAGPIGRTMAAGLDTAFLAAVGSAVLWITMRVCGLTMSDLPALPALVALPLFAFVLLIDLGYLLLFTAAGGQTLGKMAAGIRVVATSPGTGADERLDIQRAAFRSFVTLPSVLALGAGFLPALVGERRAVHDRIAQTRVVRA